MSQKPLKRIRNFKLHYDQEGGAELWAPIGDQMWTAALPDRFVFNRMLWLWLASWTRRVGWSLFRISSTETCEPKSLGL